ncbi:MAG: hypothetical protein D6733_07185 [Methanobacteriota archaeon]|nr:MAG: hypothetical protein D6733_07185 [Euryarchaeota archaeon]
MPDEKGCTEESCLKPGERLVHITVDGKDIPIGRFVQGFIMSTVVGMLSSLKKVDVKEGSQIEIRLRYRR